MKTFIQARMLNLNFQSFSAQRGLLSIAILFPPLVVKGYIASRYLHLTAEHKISVKFLFIRIIKVTEEHG